jgi:superfamily II DNA/RNA helicase
VALSFCSSGERRELRAIEQLIGQKIDISTDHAAPEIKNNKSVSQPQPSRRRPAVSRRPAKKTSGSQQPVLQTSANTTGEEDKPKPTRRRRKRWNRRQQVKQTT